MSAPVDEIDVGRDPRGRPPWHTWSSRRRRATGAVVVVLLLAAGTGWALLHRTSATPAAAPPPAASAPGAEVVEDLPADVSRCPTGAQCTYGGEVDAADESAFRAAFTSAGYIGRQTVRDTVTGEVYWQLIRFSTGTLITVTLTQQPLALVPEPPVPDDSPTAAELRSGSLELTAIREGYLMTASAAGLPGQALPVRAAQQWVRTVPAP